MSLLAMKRVWATDIQPAGRKLVALKLADHCNDSGGSLFVGMAAIARDCGVSRSQAQRHMHALVDAGLLTVTANASGGARGVVPHYRLHVERLTDPSATGSADAAHGSHGCGDGVAPMRRTGSTHATQTIINPVLTIKEPIVGKPDGPPLKKARQSHLPDGFTPNETGVAAAHGLSLEVELEQFKNYHGAKGTLMLDWQAAWRTWCGNSRKYAKPTAFASNNKPASKHSGFSQLDYRSGINADGTFV